MMAHPTTAMNPKINLCISVILSVGLLVAACDSPKLDASSAQSNGGATTHPIAGQSETNNDLTKQISAVLMQCQSIKPGMTRAELLKLFGTQGGWSNPTQRTFVYKACPIVKVDVDFSPSDPKQEQATDIIRSISKPYLAWRQID